MSQQTLVDEAVKTAKQLQAHALKLERKLQEIETQKREVEAALHAARLGGKHLSDFEPELNGDFQCPKCCADGVSSRLVPLPGTDSFDVFLCRTCQFKWVRPE